MTPSLTISDNLQACPSYSYFCIHVFTIESFYVSLGVLASHPSSRDVHIQNFSLTFHGAELLADTKLELNTGRRYGLVGLNGSGMLTLYKIVSFTAYFVLI